MGVVWIEGWEWVGSKGVGWGRGASRGVGCI